ncbi:MAG: hypothetical protein ACLRFE_00580, partial [Clostridia bacterium]
MKFANNLYVTTINSITSKDDTVFNIIYENKAWTFYAKDFELDSKVFTLDARINNLKRNGT